ncbi:hypothetical protein CMV_014961 [Castanea mollissima]|uniref:Uncharacterized protein n=1 Tax=Castanea mollissima TaxID=60419 RepID=A0A8J4RAI1_9ROSI|nr:hypothetical protein CMV_014961 [Castanea mollissima]
MKASFPFSCSTGIDRAILQGQTAPDQSQNTSAISLRLPTSPLASAQSSDNSASVNYKDASKSTQKALSLMLSAAKYGSEMRLNRSVGALSVSAEVGKANTRNISTSSQNDLAKASKILDFLSSGAMVQCCIFQLLFRSCKSDGIWLPKIFALKGTSDWLYSCIFYKLFLLKSQSHVTSILKLSSRVL